MPQCAFRIFIYNYEWVLEYKVKSGGSAGAEELEGKGVVRSGDNDKKEDVGKDAGSPSGKDEAGGKKEHTQYTLVKDKSGAGGNNINKSSSSPKKKASKDRAEA